MHNIYYNLDKNYKITSSQTTTCLIYFKFKKLQERNVVKDIG